MDTFFCTPVYKRQKKNLKMQERGKLNLFLTSTDKDPFKAASPPHSEERWFTSISFRVNLCFAFCRFHYIFAIENLTHSFSVNFKCWWRINFYISWIIVEISEIKMYAKNNLLYIDQTTWLVVFFCVWSRRLRGRIRAPHAKDQSSIPACRM